LRRSYITYYSEQSAIVLQSIHSFSSAQLKQRLRGRVGSAIYRKYNLPRVAVQSLCQGAKKTSRNLEGGSKYKNTVPSFNTTLRPFLTTGLNISIQDSRRRAAAPIQAKPAILSNSEIRSKALVKAFHRTRDSCCAPSRPPFSSNQREAVSTTELRKSDGVRTVGTSATASAAYL